MRRIYGHLVHVILICTLAVGISEAASVGDPVPNFSLQDLNGRTHTPAAYRDRVLVLYFLGFN